VQFLLLPSPLAPSHLKGLELGAVAVSRGWGEPPGAASYCNFLSYPSAASPSADASRRQIDLWQPRPWVAPAFLADPALPGTVFAAAPGDPPKRRTQAQAEEIISLALLTVCPV
jgi:hypothetical protein